MRRIFFNSCPRNFPGSIGVAFFKYSHANHEHSLLSASITRTLFSPPSVCPATRKGLHSRENCIPVPGNSGGAIASRTSAERDPRIEAELCDTPLRSELVPDLRYGMGAGSTEAGSR